MVRVAAGLAVLFVLPLGGCLHSNAAKNTSSAADQEQVVSLAAKMASMEIHMSRLFSALNAGRIDVVMRNSATELLRLQRESSALFPLEWDELPESEKRERVRNYRTSALAMADLLQELIGIIDKNDPHGARLMLERIDSFRRQCHVKFG